MIAAQALSPKQNLAAIWELRGLPAALTADIARVVVGVASVLAIVQLLILVAAETFMEGGVPEFGLQVSGRIVPLVLWFFRRRLSPTAVFTILSLTLYTAIIPWILAGEPTSAAMVLIAAGSLFCFCAFGTQVTLAAMGGAFVVATLLLATRGFGPWYLWQSVGLGALGTLIVMLCFALVVQRLYGWQSAQERLLDALLSFSRDSRRVNEVAVREIESLLRIILEQDVGSSKAGDKRVVDHARLRLARLQQEFALAAGGHRLPDVQKGTVDFSDLLFGVKSRLDALMGSDSGDFSFRTAGFPIDAYLVDEVRIREILVGSARVIFLLRQPGSQCRMSVMASRVTDQIHELRIGLAIDASKMAPTEFERALNQRHEHDDVVDLFRETRASQIIEWVKELDGFYIVTKTPSKANSLALEITIPMEPALVLV